MQYDCLALAREFIEALDRGDKEAALAYYADDVVQIEFPNQLSPDGATRDLAALREAAERGSEVLTSESYEVLSAVCQDNHVALELQWIGILAVAYGDVAAGDELRARLAIFLEFRAGKIVRQHNYDCFEL